MSGYFRDRLSVAPRDICGCLGMIAIGPESVSRPARIGLGAASFGPGAGERPELVRDNVGPSLVRGAPPLTLGPSEK